MGFIYKARHSDRLPFKGSRTRVRERTEGRRNKSETRVKCEKVKNDKHQRILAVFGAGEGNRTPVFSLGS